MKRYVHHTLEQVASVLLFLSSNSTMSWSQNSTAGSDSSASPVSTANWKTTKHGKHVTIRVNPDVDVPPFDTIAVGTVRYTGPAKSLKPQEADKLVALLQDSLSRDLTNLRLRSGASSSHGLVVNANITRVKRSHPWINVLTTAAVFVPLDLGDANVTALVMDERTGKILAEIETVGCGQIYQVLPSFRAFGQSKIALRKDSRSIARELSHISQNLPTSTLSANVMPLKK